MSIKANIPSISGAAVLKARKKLGLNQSQFWQPFGVTQSGGSRYETNRNIPAPVNRLLVLKTGTKAQKLAVLKATGIDLTDIAADILAQKEAGEAA